MPSIDFSKILDQLVYNSDMPMIFNSGIFIYLFVAFSFVYALLHKKDTLRILFVTAFSYYFYYKSSGIYFILLAVVTVSDYFLAHRIFMTDSKRLKKLYITLSLVINLGMLSYFKYTNFFVDIINSFAGSSWGPFDIFLPVGISFFTFQSLSYSIDVYRGKLKPLDRLLDYAFYVSFFPQLVAGPIVRASDFIPQIRRPLTVTREMLGSGMFLIVCGIIKKAVISDYISINFVERIFENPSLYSGIENLFGLYGYALQIYCDFSGYSDMAIGIALLLGFEFPKNFDSPYKATSVTDFWHRWHISLSTWLRDYLYISLGGNRHGKIRTYINLMLTMILGGLWHGASWNFIVWGTLHGVALAVHKFSLSVRNLPKNYKPSGWRKYVNIILTFHFVCFCWLFFRNTSFENSMTMIESIFTNFHPELFVQLVTGYKEVFILILLGFASHFIPDGFMDRMRRMFVKSPYVLSLVVLIIVVYVVIQVKSSDVQPFIYFQF